MKYFTPERHDRLGDLTDRAAFLAALDEWETANADYAAHVESIRTKLPAELLGLYKQVNLHDARVLSLHQQDDRLVMTLEPERDPSRLVVLTYSLVEEPRVRVTSPDDQGNSWVLYLYDELDLDGMTASPATPDEERPIIRHDILLSNGWELSIRFRGVHVTRPLRLLPAVEPRTVEAASA